MSERFVAAVISALVAAGAVSQACAADLGEIIYSSWGQLCSAAAQGGTDHCIEGAKEVNSPVWQPGGDLIVANRGEHDGPHELVLLRSDGKLKARLEKSSSFIRPVWSPDGNYIYAIRYSLGAQLGRWEKTGKGFRAIPILGADGMFEYVQMLAFSPSGNQLSVLVDKFQTMLIADVQPDAIKVQRQVPRNFTYVSGSAWLDESRLLFVGKQEGERQELWEMKTNDGSATKRGIQNLWLRDFITLSPDRRSVVVCGVADNVKETKWNLWKYSLESAALVRLTNGTEDVSPNWRR